MSPGRAPDSLAEAERETKSCFVLVVTEYVFFRARIFLFLIFSSYSIVVDSTQPMRMSDFEFVSLPVLPQSRSVSLMEVYLRSE